MPNSVTNPKLINTDPWEGLSAIWYGVQGAPGSYNLNGCAHQANTEMATQRFNGNLNDFNDCCDVYTCAELTLLYYERTAGVIGRFTTHRSVLAKNIDGPLTRNALHKALVELGAWPQDVTPSSSDNAAEKLAAYLKQSEDALSGLRELEMAA